VILNGNLRTQETSLADKLLLLCEHAYHDWELYSFLLPTTGCFFSRCLFCYSAVAFRTVHARSTSRYWTACFGAVVLVEHLVFRRGHFSWYHVEDWDQPRKLPPGIAAIFSGALGVGIIVLCMDQVGILIFLTLQYTRGILCGGPSRR
jgi:hypothetical protein